MKRDNERQEAAIWVTVVGLLMIGSFITHTPEAIRNVVDDHPLGYTATCMIAGFVIGAILL